MDSGSEWNTDVDGEWVAIIRSHQNHVWRYLRSLGCTPNQADDLTQETFLRLLESSFEPINPQATAGYLRKIAHSRFISYCRRESRTVTVDGIEGIDRYWTENIDGKDSGELLDHLRECIKELTERAREALELRYSNQSSRNDIAKELGISEHGAKNLIQRAKQKLKECIQRRKRRA